NAENWYAIYLMGVGRPAEAVEATRRAVAKDPLSFWAHRNLGMALFYARRYDEALAALRRASEIAPDKAAFVEGWNAAIYEAMGRYDEAVTAQIKDLTAPPNPYLSPAEVDSLRSAFATGGWKAYQATWIKILLSRAGSTCSDLSALGMSSLY